MHQEEATAAASAAAAGADDVMASDSEETAAPSVDETSSAVPPAVPPAAPSMVSMGVGFVLGHLTVSRTASWADAEAWAAGDPISVADGYARTHLHQWAVSNDEALNCPCVGEVQQCFAIHCVDRPGCTDLRASTRDSHLRFLKESGRVVKGGPLLAQPSAGEIASAGNEENIYGVGSRVGTLLIVNGDELAEVHAWAKEDPYSKAELFEVMTVAPLASYVVDTLPL